MSILIRFLWVVITGYFKPRLGFCEPSTLGQIVWPIDLDTNIHMNNSRYLAVMDLGRIDWFFRAGGMKMMHRERMSPIVGGCMVRFRRSLGPFQRFELKTRMLGWDERWIYFEQIMHSKDGIACMAVQRTGFTKAGKLVAPSEISRLIGYHGADLPAPAWVAGWNEQEQAFVRQAESHALFENLP